MNYRKSIVIIRRFLFIIKQIIIHKHKRNLLIRLKRLQNFTYKETLFFSKLLINSLIYQYLSVRHIYGIVIIEKMLPLLKIEKRKSFANTNSKYGRLY